MLVGLGLGPGDPELLTLRAVRLLREADGVFVPGRLAYELVRPYRESSCLEFPMTGDEGRILACMERNADRIAPVAKDGLAVLGILGDPNFFSTYTRLCRVMEERYPSIECTACASVAGFPVPGAFTVSDGGEPDYRILLKVRRPREQAEELRKEGFSTFVLVERMFLPEMKVYRDRDLPETCDYMSILCAGR
jgi:precorrin-2/cobalt-factor-2 C20-methyltransferase